MLAHFPRPSIPGPSDPHFTVEIFDLLLPAPHRPPLALSHRPGVAQVALRAMARTSPPGIAVELLRAADLLDVADDILRPVAGRPTQREPLIGLTVDDAIAACTRGGHRAFDPAPALAI